MTYVPVLVVRARSADEFIQESRALVPRLCTIELNALFPGGREVCLIDVV